MGFKSSRTDVQVEENSHFKRLPASHYLNFEQDPGEILETTGTRKLWVEQGLPHPVGEYV